MYKFLFVMIAGLTLLSSAGLEARSHFGFQMGSTMASRRVVAPVYVEEHYYDSYDCPCHGQVACRRVYSYPVYQERVYVQPRPFFSFGFFR